MAQCQRSFFHWHSIAITETVISHNLFEDMQYNQVTVVQLHRLLAHNRGNWGIVYKKSKSVMNRASTKSYCAQ